MKGRGPRVERTKLLGVTGSVPTRGHAQRVEPPSSSIAGIDFEAFSQVNLKKSGTCRYAEDPSTEVLCMGWNLDHGEPRVWVPGAALFQVREAGLADPNFHSTAPEELFRAIERGAKVFAWNVEMEIPMWEEVMVKRHGWPSIPRDQWRDTAVMALTLALPANLEEAGAALGLDVLKDQRGKHLLNKLAKPRRPSKKDPRTRWEPSEVPQDYADLYRYCAQDVRAEGAVHQALPMDDLGPDELELWRLTTEMNLRGWTVDIDSAHRMLALLAEYGKRATAELAKLTDGAITTGNQLDRMLAWLGERNVFLDNLQKDTIEEALADSHWMPDECVRLLELRQVLSKASLGKYVAMENRVCSDGTVKNNILHHGAGTGRDAGRGLQIQNFIRANISKRQWAVEDAFRALRMNHPLDTIELIYGSPTKFASVMTRAHLTAAPGTELYCADFAQIENRLAVWHAGCEYGLDVFRRGLDEYKQFAAGHYHVDYDDVTDAQRQHSKHAILLLVFGGGADALMAQALRFGTRIEPVEAKGLVRSYRDELYPEIPAMWYGLDRAAKRCVRTGDATSFRSVSFEMVDDFLMMSLPSGRKITYYDPRVELVRTPWGKMKPTITHMGTDDKKRWMRVKLIPGRIFENVVQGSARDQMMDGARRTTAAGYLLVGRVHDELVSQMRRALGSLREYCRLMATAAEWLHGEVPIVAEGWAGHRYRK